MLVHLDVLRLVKVNQELPLSLVNRSEFFMIFCAHQPSLTTNKLTIGSSDYTKKKRTSGKTLS